MSHQGANGAARQEALRDVNDAIRRAVGTWTLERWDFFCECSDATCRRLVNLSLEEYDERRRTAPTLTILAEHHAAVA